MGKPTNYIWFHGLAVLLGIALICWWVWLLDKRYGADYINNQTAENYKTAEWLCGKGNIKHRGQTIGGAEAFTCEDWNKVESKETK